MKFIYALIFSLAFSLSLDAQVENDKRGRQERMQSRIESQKVAFITQKLDLSPEEAQSFWPIYNEFQSKLKEFRKNNRKSVDYENIDEGEANAFLDGLFQKEQEELNIKKNYYQQLKSAVSARKVAQLYVIEKQFREEILSTIRNNMGKRKRKMRNKGF